MKARTRSIMIVPFHTAAALARIEMEERHEKAAQARLLRLAREQRVGVTAQAYGWSRRLIRRLRGVSTAPVKA
jgi:hypothetical protein